MAFLFKGRKQHHTGSNAPTQRDASGGHSPSVPGPSGSPNLGKEQRQEPGRKETPPQGTRVNDSVNSLGGTNSPSPEQRGPLREKQEADSQALRRLPNGQYASPNANALLYPWSQRRLNPTSPNHSPFPRYGAAVNSVASKDGEIFLMGGLINGTSVKGDLWVAEADGSGNLSSYPIAPKSDGPGPRVGHAALIVGNAFIVFGGDTKIDDRDVLDDTLYLLNTSTRQWSRATPSGSRPAGRYGHTLNIIGSKIYIFGGQVEGYFFNDLVAFDLNGLQHPNNHWEVLMQNSADGGPSAGPVPPARTNHTVVTWNEKLFLFGGTNGVQWFNDVWSYDPRSNSWTQLDCIGYIPAPREGHAAAIVGDVMYIFGGRTEDAHDLPDLAAFRLSSRRWYTFQNMGPSPSPRSGHSMTAYGKQVVVLGGAPSSAPRDPHELGFVYLLDTDKIRYPNDQGSPNQQGEGRMRLPSGGDKPGVVQGRGPPQREEGGSFETKDPKRVGQTIREGGPLGPGPSATYGGRTPDQGPNAAYAGRTPEQGPNAAYGRTPEQGPNAAYAARTPEQGPNGAIGGSRLPRASMSNAPSGPPPQQQAPTPRINGAVPPPSGIPGARARAASRTDRNYGPPVDTSKQSGPSDPNNSSPITRETNTQESPVTNGRRTPTQQQQKLQMKPRDAGDSSISNIGPRVRPRQDKQQGSVDSATGPYSASPPTRAPPPATTSAEDKPSEGSLRKGSVEAGSNALAQNDGLLKEIDALKSKNAWYASEMALARKSGYTPNVSKGSPLEDQPSDAFSDNDRQLVEALLMMRAELVKVQKSVDDQAAQASQQIAEVERQRDVAVSEAVYAKAKFAAHGGSQAGTPQPDSRSREVAEMGSDRTSELNRKLASALALQTELKNRVASATRDLESEKQARQLSEETSQAAQTRVSELDSFRQQSTAEIERLRSELHELEKQAREDAVQSTEAVASSKLLRADNTDLKAKLEEALAASKGHVDTLNPLREAVTASTNKTSMLEKRLEEEREARASVERKLRQLRAEHEERTAELENVTRKLRETEELAESHATEARTHRETVLSGLDKLTTRDLGQDTSSRSDERLVILQGQVDDAKALVRRSQTAADTASEKLRRAEERIAGLEAYQEQSSREGLQIRKQLQQAMREVQSLQANNTDIKQQHSTLQLESNAIVVQYGALKDLLAERGINPADARARSNASPGTGLSVMDQNRLRDLEQELDDALQAHRETQNSFEVREQEAEKAYREKLEQLEGDYQSAVHYVKGTEKMLKRMKDELAKAKTHNQKLQVELEEGGNGAASRTVTDEDAPSGWETERQGLRDEIDELQANVKNSVTRLETQVKEVQMQLEATRSERDVIKTQNAKAEQDFTKALQNSQHDLEQLKRENAALTDRAADAEGKVSYLLNQVENSVDNYRRQSRQIEPNGFVGGGGNAGGNGGGNRLSTSTVGGGAAAGGGGGVGENRESMYTLGDNRNSVALDSLASELDLLRSQWENTNKNYRLSNTFDFEKSPASTEGGELSSSLASWRKKLDADDPKKGHAKTLSGSAETTPTKGSFGEQRV